jgi:hypothetical protein
MNEAASMFQKGEEVTVDVRDAASFIRSKGFMHLTIHMNCEGCEYEVLQSLGEFEKGRAMVDGTIDRWNIATHSTPNSGLICSMMHLLNNYYEMTYCDGPWRGYVRQASV